MRLSMRPRLSTLQWMIFVFIGVLSLALVIFSNKTLRDLQAANAISGLPFGILSFPNGAVFAQDFAYNLLYFRGIRDREVEHPYRMAEQEQLMLKMLPSGRSGMTHAYSPVAMVLALPLLAVSGSNAYLLYTAICGAGLVLMLYFCLLPRAPCPLQLYALVLCLASVTVMTAFAVGQSALLTTSFFAFFWALLRQRDRDTSLLADFSLALLFWALCLKPSVAILPAMLLLGGQAWRPLLIGAALLLVTWTLTCDRYGGWITGLSDYAYLLNHYNNPEFSPFMRRNVETAQSAYIGTMLFAFDRTFIMVTNLALVGLRWLRWINGTEHVQAVTWIFLLFSPYLLPSENLILCVLIVEGTFFQSRDLLRVGGKILLLAGIMDFRSGVTFPIDITPHLKCTLFLWTLLEWWWLRYKREAPLPVEEVAPV